MMRTRVLLVTIVLVASFGLRAWVTTADPVSPQRDSFVTFPRQAGKWAMVREEVLDQETTNVLKADEYVMRSYSDKNDRQVELFIAYYKSQRAGESMHSPKNCLPGAGWGIVSADEVALHPQDPQSATINRYMIEKNAQRALVLYWYQAGGRIIANEYWGKIYLVLDALRSGRRDGAIIRFVVMIPKGSDGSAELASGLAFAQEVAPVLSKYLPNG
jgi:EpsI family protein